MISSKAVLSPNRLFGLLFLLACGKTLYLTQPIANDLFYNLPPQN